MPFLPSMASTATRMRSCGVIWIRTPTPPTPGSASPDMKPKHRFRPSLSAATTQQNQELGQLYSVALRDLTVKTSAAPSAPLQLP
jgi:hypothetical protein